MASSEGSGGSGTVGECEGDEQDDSSSHSLVLDVTEALDQIHLDSTNKGAEDELSQFRQQWQRELEHSPSQQRDVYYQLNKDNESIELLSDEEKAKKLFLLGVELEKGGKLYEAIQHYKRAIQILPDVESRLYEGTDLRAETSEDESESEEVCQEDAEISEDDEVVEGEDLLTRLQRILTRKGHFCQPENENREMHLSWLPSELLSLVLRWVVGAELDAGSLERVAASCRGLYVAARDPALWRALCVRTWGIECGVPRGHGFTSWRQMYIERARLNLDGCYISKTTYLRHGENSFQDQSYRPWYLIHYYRYLRFFPEGLVLMLTTPDEPAACVGHLRHRSAKNNVGIMSGHYRLVGDKVVILIKKTNSEKKSIPSTNTRFRARRKEVYEQQEQIFHMEFEVRSVRGRRNWQLWWARYAVSTRRDQWTAFELAAAKFPPLAFSRVRSYTAYARAPLPHV